LKKEGTSVIPLGSTEHKRSIDNPDGTMRMVHSLPSCGYLKIDESNLISFERAKQGTNNRQVKIQEQQMDYNGNTYYDDIYAVNIDEMSLRELMVINSIFMCDSAVEVKNLIQLQPNGELFQKSFMELDQSNMIQILSFDSRIVKTLLSFEFNDDFNRKYPIFYKMRHVIDGKETNVSALDVALQNNQIRALNAIITYIIEYQNSFAFYFLFDNIFLELLEKGISVNGLLESDIFCHVFEVEDYPLIHPNKEYLIMPFNGSIFQLKGTYSSVFGRDLAEDEGQEDSKCYKIKYTLILLPSVTYEDGQSTKMNELMEQLGNTEDLDIFRTKVICDFFDFQWDSYAKHLHYWGATVHLVYVILFCTYTNEVYNERNFENRSVIAWMMLICLMYPMTYDCLQLKKQGAVDYFADKWNYLDQGHIWIGVANVLVQRLQPNILS